MYEVFCIAGDKPVRIAGGLLTLESAREVAEAGPDRMIELDKTHEPDEGSVWAHRNGVEYVVMMLTNGRHRRDYPRTVVYKNRETGITYSREAIDWHRSMTAVKPPAKWPRKIGLTDPGAVVAPCPDRRFVSVDIRNGMFGLGALFLPGDAEALSAAIMDAVQEVQAERIQP